MASSQNHIEVELDTGAALRGVPMIALMLVPPNVNKVVLRTLPGIDEDGVAVTSSRSSSRAIRARDGDRAGKPKKSPDRRGVEAVTSTKRPREVSKDMTEGPVKCARQASAGPSTIKLKGKPQYVPENEVLLVLPPMPKSLHNELTFDGLDSSLTEPESSEDERARRLNKL
ncbi:hypothetical protein EDB85DRAFT_2154191 [Lactarius pseudohatsudake]|nr:hypothetical protein EDB85DRAFT_2154191 [Lactarius pseudohatsudake]